MRRLSPGIGRSALALLPLSFALSTSLAAAPVRWTPLSIMSDQYESSPTFTPDGREMYFMRADRAFARYTILWSRCENGGWTPPLPVPFAAPPPALEADPFVTADGRRLYFASSRPGSGRSGDDLDIWYVERSKDGRWGDPVRLPEPVNSPGSELLPRVASDGRIYFGSDRAGGFGQSDIYVATPAADGWQVRNLDAPVSSPANEYEVEVSRDERTLIVVADRGDRSHLYRFTSEGGRWIERERIPAAPDIFQVGPALSPRADRLLFAQAVGERSGEIFLIDLAADPDPTWPPRCGD